MLTRNFYSVLGVLQDADQPTIRRAYRRLVFSSHPNPGDFADLRSLDVPGDFATTAPSISEFLDHVAQNFFGFHRKSLAPFRHLSMPDHSPFCWRRKSGGRQTSAWSFLMRTGGRESEEGAHGRTDTTSITPGRGGGKVADICREHGVSEATYYVWKKKYSGLGLSELRELRQLREENAKLKRLVADP